MQTYDEELQASPSRRINDEQEAYYSRDEQISYHENFDELDE